MRALYFILILGLAGCGIFKNADKKLNNLNKKHPEKVASFCNVNYPCKINKSDTIYIDSIIAIDKIDTIVCTEYSVDTLVSVKDCPKKVRVKYKDKISVKVREIVKYVEDSTKITMCEGEKNILNAKIKSLERKNQFIKLLFWPLFLIIIWLAYKLIKDK